MLKQAIAVVVISVLSACGGPEDVSHFPKPDYKVKIGKPYKINGEWYSPHHNPSYIEEGIASWYGPGFHGKSTANGEKYDQYAYTAAHTTLPLPSIVRVTNLANGRSMNVRVNDRGPFHDGRIIDLSKASAQKLGVIGTGVAQVKVQYLPVESELYVKSHGKQGDEIHFADGSVPDSYHVASIAEQEAQFAKMNQVIIQPIDEPQLALAPVIDRSIESAIIGAASTPHESKNIIEVASLVDMAPVESELAEYRYEGRVEIAPIPVLAPVVETSSVTAQSGQIKLGAYVPSPPDSSWLIQVASYAETVNAENMMQKLELIGRPMVMEVDVRGRRYYRVMLKPTGQYYDKHEMLAQLASRFGIYDAKVIDQ